MGSGLLNIVFGLIVDMNMIYLILHASSSYTKFRDNLKIDCMLYNPTIVGHGVARALLETRAATADHHPSHRGDFHLSSATVVSQVEYTASLFLSSPKNSPRFFLVTTPTAAQPLEANPLSNIFRDRQKSAPKPQWHQQSRNSPC